MIFITFDDWEGWDDHVLPAASEALAGTAGNSDARKKFSVDNQNPLATRLTGQQIEPLDEG
jgi:hypothetical protein